MRTIIIILAAGALCGCAALNVSWVATVSYNANARTVSDTSHSTPEK